MINGFENEEAFAKMNHFIDIVRGNVPAKKWKSLDKRFSSMYLDEAKVASYVITNEDMDQIEEYLFRHYDER